MSTLTSQSSLADVQAAYMDNASYEENGSAAQAAAFITACRFLMLMLPKSGGQREVSMQMNPEMIQQEMADAKVWIASNPGAGAAGGGVGYFSLNFSRT
jgi:hypothetical protein